MSCVVPSSLSWVGRTSSREVKVALSSIRRSTYTGLNRLQVCCQELLSSTCILTILNNSTNFPGYSSILYGFSILTVFSVVDSWQNDRTSNHRNKMSALSVNLYLDRVSCSPLCSLWRVVHVYQRWSTSLLTGNSSAASVCNSHNFGASWCMYGIPVWPVRLTRHSRLLQFVVCRRLVATSNFYSVHFEGTVPFRSYSSGTLQSVLVSLFLIRNQLRSDQSVSGRFISSILSISKAWRCGRQINYRW